MQTEIKACTVVQVHKKVHESKQSIKIINEPDRREKTSGSTNSSLEYIQTATYHQHHGQHPKSGIFSGIRTADQRFVRQFLHLKEFENWGGWAPHSIGPEIRSQFEKSIGSKNPLAPNFEEVCYFSNLQSTTDDPP